MRQSYKIMAGILLAGIVMTALLTIVTDTPFLPELGRRMDVPVIDYSAYQDSCRMRAACEREAPEIICRDIKVWKPGDEILLAGMFVGRDTEGNPTEIEVSDIRSQNGDSKMECYQKEEGKIVFSQKGMYLLELQTTDRQNKSGRKSFILLIDSR